MPEKIIIAIDGYSSCGKSTLAKDLSKYLNYICIDSGAMYRAVTLSFLNEDVDISNDDRLHKALDKLSIQFIFDPLTNKSITLLNGKDVEAEIRTMRIAQKVGMISALPAVREKLLLLQQEIGEEKGIVMEGRDIGTVVFPNAELKIFMTASMEVRVKRRYEELRAKGVFIQKEEVENNLKARDKSDTERELSPLRIAEDAIEVDTSNMDLKEQIDHVIRLVDEKLT